MPVPPVVPVPAAPPEALLQQHQALEPPIQDQALLHQDVHPEKAPQAQVHQNQQVIGFDRVLRDRLPMDY